MGSIKTREISFEVMKILLLFLILMFKSVNVWSVSELKTIFYCMKTKCCNYHYKRSM
jgi:hypothetical protein